ncbi:hypothetical protein ACLB2K_022198 [Fragaria x ananassa]
MGTLAPNSIAAEAHDRNHQDQVVDGNHAKVVGDHDAVDDKLDAGAKIVGALWLSFDDINSCSTTAKSAIRFHISGMDGRNCLFGHRSISDFLLIQLDLSGARALRSVGTSPSSVPRHGS